MKVLNQTHLMRSHHFYDDIGTFRRTLTQSGSLHGQKCRNVSYARLLTLVSNIYTYVYIYLHILVICIFALPKSLLHNFSCNCFDPLTSHTYLKKYF